MNSKLLRLCRSRDLVAIFRGLAQDDVFDKLMILLGSDKRYLSNYFADYSDFVTELYSHNTADLTKYILQIAMEDENVFIKEAASGCIPPHEMQECLVNELLFLQEVSQLTPADFMAGVEYDGYIPQWTTSKADFVESYKQRLMTVANVGYGKWTKSNMFIFRDGICPVKHPDTQKLSELFGYEAQRKAIIDNTLALLDGKPALNALLYGDAGTGKSSTVKAVANEYADSGLRLIEISKEQLREIPGIIDEISRNPLKFIIFIDDLSFVEGEDCFGSLKAILEGSAAARSRNMVIYATSNRRHLVKEKFSDREGDDIHRNDTMQETLSLSSRFGLRVNFNRPDKKEYIMIASKLAKLNELDMKEEELAEKAEQFALSSGNGRSPRTAKQFIHQVINNIQDQT